MGQLWRIYTLQILIDFAPGPNPYDNYYKYVFLNPINYPIITMPYPEQITRTLEFC